MKALWNKLRSRNGEHEMGKMIRSHLQYASRYSFFYFIFHFFFFFVVCCCCGGWFDWGERKEIRGTLIWFLCHTMTFEYMCVCVCAKSNVIWVHIMDYPHSYCSYQFNRFALSLHFDNIANFKGARISIEKIIRKIWGFASIASNNIDEQFEYREL